MAKPRSIYSGLCNEAFGARPVTVLVSPSLQDACIEITSGIEGRKLIVLVVNCSINYSGRTGSQLGKGDRLVILKKDGCVLVHRGKDYQPVNWQPSGCILQATLDSPSLIVKAVRPNPLESLTITVSDVHFLGTFELEDEAEVLLHASEEDMQRAILVEPDIVEPGLKVVDFEKKVPPGFVDVYGLDPEGNTVVIEIKKDSAGLPAVKQLSEYLKHLHASPGKKLRPFIVAPALAKGVQPVLEKRGIEYKQLSLQRAAEILQKHARSDQKVLGGWLDRD